jgi:hypothetical protein
LGPERSDLGWAVFEPEFTIWISAGAGTRWTARREGWSTECAADSAAVPSAAAAAAGGTKAGGYDFVRAAEWCWAGAGRDGTRWNGRGDWAESTGIR